MDLVRSPCGVLNVFHHMDFSQGQQLQFPMGFFVLFSFLTVN